MTGHTNAASPSPIVGSCRSVEERTHKTQRLPQVEEAPRLLHRFGVSDRGGVTDSLRVRGAHVLLRVVQRLAGIENIVKYLGVTADNRAATGVRLQSDGEILDRLCASIDHAEIGLKKKGNV